MTFQEDYKWCRRIGPMENLAKEWKAEW